jgi:purine-binding chemotaxis protein CheW
LPNVPGAAALSPCAGTDHSTINPLPVTMSTPLPAVQSAGTAAGSTLQSSLFLRQRQLFCLDVAHVQEVLQTGRLTQVPQAPASVAGVMNLRGEVLPVILADAWLQLPDHPYDLAKPIIVLRRKQLLVGIQVDAVQRIGQVPQSEVIPNPLASKAAYLSGIWFRPGQALATIVDGGALLDAIQNQLGESATEVEQQPQAA